MDPKRPLFPIYDILEHWAAFAFGTPEVKPQHHALYQALVYQCKVRCGMMRFPMAYQHGMQLSGIGSKGTYLSALKELEGWGFLVYTPGANAYKTPIVEVRFKESTGNLLDLYRYSYKESTDTSTGHNKEVIREEGLEEAKNQLIVLEGQHRADVAALAALSLEKDHLLERLEKATKEFRALRTENDTLKAQLAAKQTRSAATAKRHAFADSPYADVQAVARALAGTDYEHADLPYYHEAIRNWAEGKDERKADWLATIRNAMLRDSKENQLKLNPNSTHTPYVDPQRNAATIREREQRLGLVDTGALAQGLAISRQISAAIAAGAAGTQGAAYDGSRSPR